MKIRKPDGGIGARTRTFDGVIWVRIPRWPDKTGAHRAAAAWVAPDRTISRRRCRGTGAPAASAPQHAHGDPAAPRTSGPDRTAVGRRRQAARASVSDGQGTPRQPACFGHGGDRGQGRPRPARRAAGGGRGTGTRDPGRTADASGRTERESWPASRRQE